MSKLASISRSANTRFAAVATACSTVSISTSRGMFFSWQIRSMTVLRLTLSSMLCPREWGASALPDQVGPANPGKGEVERAVVIAVGDHHDPSFGVVGLIRVVLDSDDPAVEAVISVLGVRRWLEG